MKRTAPPGSSVFLFSEWLELMVTLPETNICAPENRVSQKEISSSNHPFSRAMLVLGRVSVDLGHRWFGI